MVVDVSVSVGELQVSANALPRLASIGAWVVRQRFAGVCIDVAIILYDVHYDEPMLVPVDAVVNALQHKISPLCLP